MNAPSLTPTLEDYLEAIYRICSFNKVARSMEIADKLNVKRSSVTVALRSLSEKGLINYQARSFVTLTEEGLFAARCVDNKHHILSDLFTTLLAMTSEEADKAACGMEHGMTAEVCRKMAALLKVLDNDKETAKKITQSVPLFEKQIDCKHDCGYNSPTDTIDDNADDQNMNYDLNSLKPGERGVIIMILGSGSLKKRLQEMGVTRGQEILVVRAAPLDDPIEIQVRNFYLSLRREEASLVIIKKVP